MAAMDLNNMDLLTALNSCVARPRTTYIPLNIKAAMARAAMDDDYSAFDIPLGGETEDDPVNNDTVDNGIQSYEELQENPYRCVP
jgi:hypothetical protein